MNIKLKYKYIYLYNFIFLNLEAFKDRNNIIQEQESLYNPPYKKYQLPVVYVKQPVYIEKPIYQPPVYIEKPVYYQKPVQVPVVASQKLNFNESQYNEKNNNNFFYDLMQFIIIIFLFLGIGYLFLIKKNKDIKIDNKYGKKLNLYTSTSIDEDLNDYDKNHYKNSNSIYHTFTKKKYDNLSVPTLVVHGLNKEFVSQIIELLKTLNSTRFNEKIHFDILSIYLTNDQYRTLFNKNYNFRQNFDKILSDIKSNIDVPIYVNNHLYL